MADTTTQADRDLGTLVHEQAQMIQALMKQQAETEETSGYQISDLRKQIICLRMQRADDLQRYEEKTKDLQKQLAGKDARFEALESRVQQLIDDVRNSATAAATEVLDQFNKSPDPLLNVRLNKLEEKNEQIHKTVEDTRRYMGTQQDEVDVHLESLGSRLRQLKDDISNINSDTVAKAVAETDLKGRSVTKMRAQLEELEGQVKDVVQTSKDTSARVNELKLDVAGCKNTFAFINRATQAHTGQKVNNSGSGKHSK
jgi:hypothetical protein